MAEIQIHVASEEERIAAYHNVHEAWGGSTPIAEYVERRLKSPKQQRATAWVLTLDHHVATSLLCYPLEFAIPQPGSPPTLLKGFGLGAVHTPPRLRRRGLAARLCETVCQHQAAHGRQVGLLFSDINPDYYRRLGFASCGIQRWRTDDLLAISRTGEAARLTPISTPLNTLKLLDAAYQAHHSQDTLYLHRSNSHWVNTVGAYEGDLFLEVESGAGYVRIVEHLETETLYVVELPLLHQDEQLRACVYRALAHRCLSASLKFISGWDTPPQTLRHHFTNAPLTKAIPMIASFNDAHPNTDALANGARFWSADHF